MMFSGGDFQLETPMDLSIRLGIQFQDISLLIRALTHRSYINEYSDSLEDNERLEFLGDAVLDFLVGAWLYNRFPEMAEGQLTRIRAALVGNQQLAEFARQVNLGAALRLGKGENEGGGRNRSALLGSTFEAFIGALFLDQGIMAVRHFVEPMLEDATRQILLARRDYDPKSQLQEWSQSKGFGPPIYHLLSANGPDHNKIFEVEVIIDNNVYGRGEGKSKQAAAKLAARNALDSLELISDAS